LVKKYDIEKGILVACAEEQGLHDPVWVRWNRSRRAKITMLTEESTTPIVKKIRVKDGCIRLALPKTELALFAIEEM